MENANILKKAKRALIITMTCGEGHNSVSRALKESLNNSGFETSEVEVFGYSNFRVKFENWQCIMATKYFSGIYDIVWNSLNKANPKRRYKLAINGLLKKSLKYLSELCNDFKPDIIIATHPYSAVAVSNLRRFNLIDNNIKTFSVLTDYCVHPLWEAGIHCDYIFSPAENTTQELLRRGYMQEQIKSIGYAVSSKFKVAKEKSASRQELGIEDKFTVMVMSGGFGMRNDTNIVKELKRFHDEIQIVCICGRNEKNKKKLERFVAKNNLKNVIVKGFVNNIEVIMSAADCLLTISGGVSVTEALYVNVPLIIREKMRTNYKLNKKFLVESGSALSIDSIKQLSSTIEKLKSNNALIENIKNSQNSIVNRNSSDDIVKFINEKL